MAARKPRIGLRCYNPYIPNEIWELFKPAFRKLLKLAFPEQKLAMTEYYWQGFPVMKEYIRLTPKDSSPVDWEKVWALLSFTTEAFGIKIECLYKEDNGLEILHEETGFERPYSDYSLASNREWTIQELNDFLSTYSFDDLKTKYRTIWEDI